MTLTRMRPLARSLSLGLGVGMVLVLGLVTWTTLKHDAIRNSLIGFAISLAVGATSPAGSRSGGCGG